MHSISGYNITLTRGDTLFLKVGMKDSRTHEDVTPEEGSSIRFAMKLNYTDPDEEIVLLKDISTDTMILEFRPEDTKDLPMGKTYVYDIEYTDAMGHVDTFIEGKFKIGKEVY